MNVHVLLPYVHFCTLLTHLIEDFILFIILFKALYLNNFQIILYIPFNLNNFRYTKNTISFVLCIDTYDEIFRLDVL